MKITASTIGVAPGQLSKTAKRLPYLGGIGVKEAAKWTTAVIAGGGNPLSVGVTKLYIDILDRLFRKLVCKQTPSAIKKASPAPFNLDTFFTKLLNKVPGLRKNS